MLSVDEREELIQEAVERTIRCLPAVINHLIKHSTTVTAKTEEMFKNNPDLAKDKDMVAKVMQKLEADNPAWSYDKVFAETPKAVRQAQIDPPQLSMDFTKPNPGDFDINEGGSNGAI